MAGIRVQKAVAYLAVSIGIALMAIACTSVTLDTTINVSESSPIVVAGTTTIATPASVAQDSDAQDQLAQEETAQQDPVQEEGVPPSTVAPREPIVLGFAGDSTFTNGLETRDPFGAIAPLLAAPDLMIINLETAVADAGVGRPPVDKAFLFKSPPESLDLLVEAGIDGVTLGNNHTLDYGVPALEQTLNELDSRGLLRTGAGLNEAAAYEPLIVEVGEWTVGIVSFSRVPCDWSASGVNSREQVAWACPPFMELADATVRQALDEADVVVVAVHGGEEGVLCPSPFMTELEAHWADLGAHAVIDGHPHVLQGVTFYGDTIAAHSTGNFAFPPARGISGNTAIVELVISEEQADSAPLVEMRIVPVRSDGGVLSVPTDSQRTEIIDQMNGVSNGALVGADGTVTAAPDHVGTC